MPPPPRARTLSQAMEGTDVFFGLSVKGALTQDMVASMADKPIIFAMANPDPEITPEEARAVSPHAIIATGRSDYPNQVNNVLGFPYIFRGALDVRASTINDAMKIAAAEALAKLAREDVPDEVHSASTGRRLAFGPEYIIPNAFDPRLIARVPPAVAKAAMDSGVARKPLEDLRRYTRSLSGRLDPTADALDATMEMVRENPRRVVFAEGEEQKVVRAAVAFRNAGYGRPILIGREDRVRSTLAGLGLGDIEGIEIHNARLSGANSKYVEFLYNRLQRQGHLHRDVQRMVNQDRNVFAACMVATGDADAMVTGLTRSASVCLNDIRHAIGPAKGGIAFGLTLLVGMRGKTIFLADSLVNFRPDAAQLADIVIGAAAAARHLGHEPRVALLSHSTFGDPPHDRAIPMRDAVEDPGSAKSRFRVRRGNESGCRARAIHSCVIPVLPPDRECQRSGRPRPPFGPHRRAAGASSRRGHHNRSAADRHGKAGPDRSDGCVFKPDRRSGLPGRLPSRQPVGGRIRSAPRRSADTKSDYWFGILPDRKVALGLVSDHFHPAGDLTAVFDLQAAAPSSSKHLTGAPHDETSANGQRAIDGASDFGILDLHFALENAARRDRELGRMDHGRLDRALDNEAFSVLHHALDADAASDNERAAVGRITAGWTAHCNARPSWGSWCGGRRSGGSGRKRRSRHVLRILQGSGTERRNAETTVQGLNGWHGSGASIQIRLSCFEIRRLACF